LKRVVVVALLSTLLWAAPAGAATQKITIMDGSFSPTPVTVLQGTTVQWSNLGSHDHTSTSNEGFWSSPHITPGTSFSRALRDAGSFGYHCTIHTGMKGIVRVPLVASGTSTAGWRLRWTVRQSVPSTITYDIQVLKPGTSTWRGFRTNTSVRSAFFNSTLNGLWKFRARTDNVTTAQSSGWSPVLSVRIS
jgi:plastocyanin